MTEGSALDHGGMPVTATTAAPGTQGRVFYNDDLTGFNFRREQVPLRVVLDTLLKYRSEADAPTIYVASTTLDTYLPGLREVEDLSAADRVRRRTARCSRKCPCRCAARPCPASAAPTCAR